jgi:hypothetical protein
MYKPLDNSFYLIDPADKMNGSIYFFLKYLADKMNASMYEPQVNSFYLIDRSCRQYECIYEPGQHVSMGFGGVSKGGSHFSQISFFCGMVTGVQC